MKKLFLTCFCCASAVLGARAQDEHIVIWDNASAPTSSGLFGPTVIEKEVFVANNNVAELFVYKAEEPSGRAVVVCPGGGYHNLAIGYEGHDMARWLADHGTTAAVLKYRMPNGHCEVPRNDAEQALRIMREHAAEWGYDASRVGIVGSSAGGHLAASTGTISDEKPAFMILFYPVITAEEGKLHKNSFKYLLGKDYSPEEARNYSLEKRVSALTPPTLLLLSDDDPDRSAGQQPALLRGTQTQRREGLDPRLPHGRPRLGHQARIQIYRAVATLRARLAGTILNRKNINQSFCKTI